MKITTNYNSNQKYQQHFGILYPPKGKALEIINKRIGTDLKVSETWTETFLRIFKLQADNKAVNMRIVANKDGDDLFVGVYKGDNKTLLKDFQEKDYDYSHPMNRLGIALKDASGFATDQIKILENAKQVQNPSKYVAEGKGKKVLG